RGAGALRAARAGPPRGGPGDPPARREARRRRSLRRPRPRAPREDRRSARAQARRRSGDRRAHELDRGGLRGRSRVMRRSQGIEATIQELVDRHEIADLISRYGAMADDKAFDDGRSCFTEDVVAEYPSGSARGVDVLAEYGRRALGAFERTQHVITNCLIDVDGDRATVR